MYGSTQTMTLDMESSEIQDFKVLIIFYISSLLCIILMASLKKDRKIKFLKSTLIFV